MLHRITHQLGHTLLLAGSQFHHEFIVDLQHDAAVQVAVPQSAIHADHRDLHDVCGSALNRGVQCTPFRGISCHPVGRCQGGEITPSTKHRLRIAGIAGIGYQRLQIIMHFAEGLEIPRSQCSRLLRRDAQLLREPIGAQPVGQPIAHCLHVVALVGRHLVDRDAVHHTGHIPVEVRP